MLLSKEDFKLKIGGLNMADDETITLLEDIEDSWNYNDDYMLVLI